MDFRLSPLFSQLHPWMYGLERPTIVPQVESTAKLDESTNLTRSSLTNELFFNLESVVTRIIIMLHQRVLGQQRFS